MIQKQTIESQLNCKATAELNDSVINDMSKTDGSLKELLDDTTVENNEDNSDRSSSELSE
jgi:hypothetical protein